MVSRLLAIFALCVQPLMTNGQINPVIGYVITNEGDTIHGTIDYRMDSQNGQSCLFMPSGATDYREYLPSEIQGFRLYSDGVYYVSRSFPVEGTDKLIFAEYLLQGGVSLYHYKENGIDYYFLVDEMGQVATIKDEKPSFSLTEANTDKLRAFKRRQMHEAGQLLAKSPKAMQQLWEKDINARNLTKIVRQYDEQYCRDYGECVQYQYDAQKNNSVRIRFRVEAGIDVIWFTADGRYSDFKGSFVTPACGIGAEFFFPRLSNSLSVETSLLFSFGSMTDKVADYNSTLDAEVKLQMLHLRIGPSYTFHAERGVSPLVHGGVIIGNVIGLDSKNMENFEIGQLDSFGEIKPWHNRFAVGAYAGAGVNIKEGEHLIRIFADYAYTSYLSIESRSHTFSLHAAFTF